MVQRHKRARSVTNLGLFEADMTKVHQLLMPYLIGLQPGSPHYDAVQRLQTALVASVCDVTGRQSPPWAHR
ncbi:MAG: hypothetical protein DI629_03660 [Mesorhizobium amorphae]|nr:MAG: hypothetical protein DI629_03660 [Mesorhizobium amorphae]